MKKLILISLLGTLSPCLNAQQYRTALGIKGDYSTVSAAALAELSVKTFVLGANALEFNLGFSQRHIWLQTMYHHNRSLTNELEWYWGAGVDVGYEKRGNYGREDIAEQNIFWGGFTGVGGIEYTFNVIPINLALDTGPTMRIYPDVKFGWTAGFAVRYGFR